VQLAPLSQFNVHAPLRQPKLHVEPVAQVAAHVSFVLQVNVHVAPAGHEQS
jgi:hypothetical protein